ncbi:MAG: SEC-C domain-containing protein [Patescibacteria group bacterium]|nr:SEC-C domain-containing protein [Patescibacteria group bacterium]
MRALLRRILIALVLLPLAILRRAPRRISQPLARRMLEMVQTAHAPAQRQKGRHHSVQIVGIPVARNARCPCRSGRKFKHCCARRGEYLTFQPPGLQGKKVNGKTLR